MLAPVFAHSADDQGKVSSRVQGPNTWCRRFEINWAWATFYAFFLAYGYYGALAPSLFQFKHKFISSGIQLLMLAGMQITLGWVALRYPQNFKDYVTVTSRDLFVFISLCLLLLLFSYDRLNFSLFSDELSYAGSAHGHAIYLAMATARHIFLVEDYVFSYLVQAASLLLLAVMAYLFYLSGYWTAKKRIIVFVVLLLVARLVFAIKGGNGSPHPPIQLIPPFLLGSLLGINNVSFKLSYFLAYIGFLTLLWKMLIRVYPLAIAYATTLTIGSIPLLLNMSSVVEHSFWSFMCFSLVFTELLTSPRARYVRLVGFISIMTMMRQPSFLALLPVCFMFLVEAIQENRFKKGIAESLRFSSLQLLFIPFLASSLMNGTPSTNAWNQGSNLDRVFQAIENGVVWDSMSFSLPFWWLAFLPLSFLPFQRKSVQLNIALILFFFGAIYLYYSIHPSLWGLTKYQVEYGGPLVIIGFLLMVKVAMQHKMKQLTLLILIVSLLILNVFQLIEQKNGGNLQNSFFRKEKRESGEEFDLLMRGMTAIPYEYEKAYAYIKQMGLTESTYSIGATYGILPEIINGYTTKAVMVSYEIYLGQHSSKLKNEYLGVDVDTIERDSRIKAVIVGALEEKEKLINEFEIKGWHNVAKFSDLQYSTSVVILTRP